MQKKGGIFSKIMTVFGIIFISLIAVLITFGIITSKTTNSANSELGSNDLVTATAQCNTYCNSIGDSMENHPSPKISPSDDNFVCSCLNNYGEPNEEVVGTKLISSQKLKQDEKLLEQVEPYIKPIVTSDVNLRATAGQITKDCDVYYRKECEVDKIYRHIAENFRYISDPNIQIVQTPYDTTNINGGDCEDLSILINSYLENLGHDTAVILTPSHAYSAVCNVNATALREISTKQLLEFLTKRWSDSSDYATYITKGSDLYEVVEAKPFKSILEIGQSQYLGLAYFNSSQHDFVDTEYNVEASDFVEVYVLDSFEEWENYKNDKTFDHYKECQRNAVSVDAVCTVDSSAGIVIKNVGPDRNRIEVKTKESRKIKKALAEEWGFSTDLKITTYRLNDEGVECLVLDPTAGLGGYPGYDWNLNSSKILVTTKGKEVKDYGYEEYLRSKGFI